MLCPLQCRDNLHHLLAHGRVGYDFLCEAVFPASQFHWWVWGLIAGVFLAYGLAIPVVTYSVKKQRGCTTVFVWLKLILSLIVIDIVTYGIAQILREIGICHWNLHFTNWFILG